ncbi:MAG: YihY/virulence factor BrkB family protein [Chloroflexi bacterium]|nr:YihY/virulence factor BrkB family protein [Chloroflexota bacterium]
MITRALAFVRQVYHGYTNNRGGLMAAAISYYALISVIPLLLLSMFLFGLALQSSEGAITQTAEVIGLSIPGSSAEVGTWLREIKHTTSATGITGLLALLWTGSQLFHVLEDALNRTWGVTRTRPFWKGRLLALLVMLFGGVLLLANLGLSITTQWVQSRRLPWGRETLAHVPFVWGSLAYVVPLLFSVIVFSMIYLIMPNTKTTWRESLVAGVFAGICWEVAKTGFGCYVSVIGERGYSRLYGSLGGLAIIVFWVYYTANILIIGGEVGRTWCSWTSAAAPTRRPRRPLTPPRPRGSAETDRPPRRRPKPRRADALKP